MKKLLLSTAVLLCAPAFGVAQTAPATLEDTRPSGAEAFTPDNAILNTAILFAVGAREAQQSIRNAFGWPTFQEGLVKGVYFRFDPDGYARFSPSPRLDTDVFEVICRPRTYSCLARKGPLALVLTSDGRVQMSLDEVQATDTFALNDGFSELQIPPRINGVLEPQMETLLSSGGSLVIRRNGEPFENLSLQGFSAVLSYLRWVAARQDYSILPRDWPVPNGVAPDPSLTTQAPGWPSAASRSAPVLGAQQNAPAVSAGGGATASIDEVAQLRTEIALLRDMLLGQSAQGGGATPTNMTQPRADMPPAPTHLADAPSGNVIEGEPSTTRDEILAQLEALRSDMGLGSPDGGNSTQVAPEMALESAGASGPGAAMPAPSPTAEKSEVRHLRYLTEEMGFPTRTALLVLELSFGLSAADTDLVALRSPSSPANDLLEGLSALSESIPEREPAPLATAAEHEYKLLGAYFRSVLEE